MHRGFARDKVEPVIPLGFFPPKERGHDIDLDRDALKVIVMAFTSPASTEFARADEIFLGRFRGIDFGAHGVAACLNGALKPINVFIANVEFHFLEASMTFSINARRVSKPTPPGTGVCKATGRAGRASPCSLPSSPRLMPTSTMMAVSL